MADSCVNWRHCGTGMPGWLNGNHPSVTDGVVRRRVCLQWSNYCCARSTMTDVRNCGKFYVYNLKAPPLCNSRYCGNGLASILGKTVMLFWSPAVQRQRNIIYLTLNAIHLKETFVPTIFTSEFSFCLYTERKSENTSDSPSLLCTVLNAIFLRIEVLLFKCFPT